LNFEILNLSPQNRHVLTSELIVRPPITAHEPLQNFPFLTGFPQMIQHFLVVIRVPRHFRKLNASGGLTFRGIQVLLNRIVHLPILNGCQNYVMPNSFHGWTIAGDHPVHIVLSLVNASVSSWF
jgi:hypothetical protein